MLTHFFLTVFLWGLFLQVSTVHRVSTNIGVVFWRHRKRWSIIALASQRCKTFSQVAALALKPAIGYRLPEKVFLLETIYDVKKTIPLYPILWKHEGCFFFVSGNFGLCHQSFERGMLKNWLGTSCFAQVQPHFCHCLKFFGIVLIQYFGCSGLKFTERSKFMFWEWTDSPTCSSLSLRSVFQAEPFEDRQNFALNCRDFLYGRLTLTPAWHD